MEQLTFDFKKCPTFTSESKVWLTSDYHFGHAAILEYTKRPWTHIEVHDRALIRNAREVVTDKDVLIINGDFTMFGSQKRPVIEKTLRKIPGKKILVYGNHDKLKPFTYVDMGFIMATTALVLEGGILVAHDPAAAVCWPKDKPVLCGHIHDLFRSVDNVVNVGVDVWGYAPVELETAVKLCTFKQKPIDWQFVSKSRHDLAKEYLKEWM